MISINGSCLKCLTKLQLASNVIRTSVYCNVAANIGASTESGDQDKTAKNDGRYFTQLFHNIQHEIAGNADGSSETIPPKTESKHTTAIFEKPQNLEEGRVEITRTSANSVIFSKKSGIKNEGVPRAPPVERKMLSVYGHKEFAKMERSNLKKDQFAEKVSRNKGESITSQLLRSHRLSDDRVQNASSDLELAEQSENVMDLTKMDPLAPCTDHLDQIAPVLPLSFNLAAYANKSRTLQQMLKLGVDLSNWDTLKGVPDFVLKLDFDRDVAPYIKFLHDVGIAAEDLGRFLSKNPRVLMENLDTLGVRTEYMVSKKFNAESITRILTAQPRVLQLNVMQLDKRLGDIQKLFKLNGNELRHVATRNPRIIIHNWEDVKIVQFSIREEMGFDDEEIKTMIISKPKLWLIKREDLVHRFNFIHNKMEIPHNLMVHFPGVLLARNFIVRQRHLFLKTIGRDQYDPTKEGYVSLKALVSETDSIFCRDVAKFPVTEFNKFLKTL